uniref:ATP synthase F0 subunit 8 n=1 Tax=Phaenocarpa sp. QL-2014 TaxID=1491723 RepID=A0A0U1WEI8_9HYME|nr:ATP synthase F0 subunit 8 [Phaenocarpa sp. QL-2014]
MPQMSSMDWFMISIFFLFLYYLLFMLIYFFILNNINKMSNKINFNNFLMTW